MMLSKEREERERSGRNTKINLSGWAWDDLARIMDYLDFLHRWIYQGLVDRPEISSDLSWGGVMVAGV